jgi:hypothetical protein
MILQRRGPEKARAPSMPTRTTIALVAALAGFVALATFFALYLVSWDAEWGYLTLGRLVLEGKVGLFQDEMIGERLPLPYYLIGLSQMLGGPSALAGRLTSAAVGALALLLTFRLGSRVNGPACGLLATGFLATQGVVVAYYAAASYYALCAALAVGGLAALASLPRPWSRVVCMACFVAIAFSRANFAVMAPFILVYLLYTAATRVERLAVLAVFALPPVVFFASSVDHLKIFAFVPVLDRLVAPLGYRSGFSLGLNQVFAGSTPLEALVWFGKRHFFWLVSTSVLALGWLLARRYGGPAGAVSTPPLVRLAGVLAVYTLAWQAVILRDYPKSVAAWAACVAPLWALVLGYGASVLLDAARSPIVVRGVVAAVLAVAFAVGPSMPRHAAMPTPLPYPGTTISGLHLIATTIRTTVPPGERVFVLGNPLPAYLAGTPPYLQQALHHGTFVPSEDAYAIARSGLWGRRELEQWLGFDARYALIDDRLFKHLLAVPSYRPLMARMAALLERHFEAVGSVADRSGTVTLGIFRRRSSSTAGLSDASGPRTAPRGPRPW